MSNIVEISRRAMYTADDGTACGPVGVVVIDAEIVVDDNGHPVYLHAQWIDVVGDEIVYKATPESLYGAYERLSKTADDDDDYEEAIEERDRIAKEAITDDACYKPFYAELKQMVLEVMSAHGIERDVNICT